MSSFHSDTKPHGCGPRLESIISFRASYGTPSPYAYYKGSPLQKLKFHFKEKFGTSIIHSERILPIVCAPWWNSPKLFIEPTAGEAIAAHGKLISCTLDELIVEKDPLNIYTDGSGIDGEVGAAA